MLRRHFVGGLAGLVGAGSVARANESHGHVIQGAESWSESLMLLHFDPILANGISVRVSRYPERNVTWVWCHVLADGHIYSYTERRLPCSRERNTPDLVAARYDSETAGVAFRRVGTVGAVQRIELSAHAWCRSGGDGVDGPGDVPVVIEASFRPDAAKDNLPTGRAEWTGTVEIHLTVGGRPLQLSGIAKAHEQIQIAPRFNDPFTYAMTWSPTASFIATASRGRRYGNLEIDGVARAVTSFAPAPPAAERHFSVVLDDGETLDGVARRVAHYDVPVFDRFWNGNIVRVELGRNQLIGMMNDWRPEGHEFDVPPRITRTIAR
jgi:hypothetical protein